MKAMKGGLIQRSDPTARTLAATPTTTNHTIARISRPTNDLFCATRALSGCSAHALHDDRVDRNIVEAAPPAGLDRGDLVDHVHAVGNAGEHGVAEVAARGIEKIVVLQIDEKLRGRAVDVVGARHGERAAFVLEAVVRLVLDGRLRALLRHVFGEASALDDEAGHDAVKDGAVEEAIVDIAQEIGNGQRGILLEELDGEIAQRGFEADHEVSWFWE